MPIELMIVEFQMLGTYSQFERLDSKFLWRSIAPNVAEALQTLWFTNSNSYDVNSQLS